MLYIFLITMKVAVVLSLFLVSCYALATRQQNNKFPDDFIFGTATASYQIEGAWDVDGKGENIWDRMTHTKPDVIKDQSNGDIAADSYNNYKRDVEMMRELGLDAYRLSLSWSRILPTGFADQINQAGVDFYNNYINEMLQYNIQPMVTLYHWDLPQPLQDLGGFANPLILEWFEDYARVAFELFGDRVKYWITFNEPREICYLGYGGVLMAPRLNATGSGTYICAKNLLLSHAKAYYAYVNDYKPTQGGICGITVHADWFGPETDSDEDEFAAEIRRQGQWGLYTEPVFSEKGGFPEELAQRVAEKSAQQGFPRSRMPEFTDEERDLVKGSYDFFGLNHYTSELVSATKYFESQVVPSLGDDEGVGTYQSEEWRSSVSDWLKLAPNSLYNVLTYLSKKYNYPPIIITENGFSSTTGLDDEGRIQYYKSALQSALDAMSEGVQLKGYMAWSLLDNFEWMQGYTERFGLYEVDFEDPARTRTPRKSAFVYKQIVKTRTLDHDYEPVDSVMTIDEGH